MASDEQQPTREELVARAQQLVPVLRANAAQTEADRKVADASMAALKEAGMYRLSTPVEFGGYGVSTRTQVEVLSELGRGDASTGWIVANDCACTQMATLLPEQGITDMFAKNADAVLCSSSNLYTSQAIPVEDGWKITGEFAFASGCEVADWILLLAIPVIEGSGDEHPTHALSVTVPLSQTSIKDTWHVAGMRGTGTHTVVVEDLFVPAGRGVALPYGEDGRFDEHLAPSILITGNINSMSPLIGAARGALDTVTAMLEKGKPLSYTIYERSSDSPIVRLWLAEATHKIDSAYQHMYLAADLLDAIDPASRPGPAERGRIRRHMAAAMTDAREGVHKLLDLGGAGGFASANPLQRYWRDLEIGSRHAMMNPLVAYEDYSRGLFGEGPVSVVL